MNKKEIIIIGNGKMALSLALGLEKDFSISLVGRNIAKLESFAKELKNCATTSKFDGFDVSNKDVLLCVKPHALSDVGVKLEGEARVLYSVLAGTSISSLKNSINSKHYIRTMPNLGAEFLNSTTTLTGDESFKDEAIKIFSKIGNAIWLDSEKELDIATSIAGSGPAFLAIVAEAMADGGVNCGLSKEKASLITASLFYSMPKLLQKYHPAIIKDGVTSPNGTTSKGLEMLESGKVRYYFIDAIKTSYIRTTLDSSDFM